VIDDLTANAIEMAVRRESRSFIQYAVDAFPWSTPAEQQALAQFDTIAAEERQALGELSDYLFKQRHFGPQLGPYPMVFTSMNYVSLEHMLPLLAENGRQAVTLLEEDIGRVTDGGAREILTRYLDLKRNHVTALKNLAAANPETVSTRR
jgi:hypothetical protein